MHSVRQIRPCSSSPLTAASPAVSGLFEPVQAPWIRPGVVIHDPSEPIDGLLAQFALILRGRGFNVAGYVQSNNRGCDGGGAGCAPRIDYFDLATSETLTVERGAAIRYLRKAMREDADLLIISRFAACTEATESVRASVGDTVGQGLPLLTSIAGQCIHKWHSYVRQDGAMIAPDLTSLWRWWGPERLYQDLALGVADDEVVRIAFGERWVMVQGPDGAGLAQSARSLKGMGASLRRWAGQSLRTLAHLARSWDPAEAALGLAAINAHYNRFDLEARPGNGAAGFRDLEGRVVVFGAFPGRDAILPDAAIIDIRSETGAYPPQAADTLLPGCAGAIINASALADRSLPRLLRLAHGARVGLVGPATPLCGQRLHAYGLSVLGGLVVTDASGLASALQSGASAREFVKFGRYVHVSP